MIFARKSVRSSALVIAWLLVAAFADGQNSVKLTASATPGAGQPGTANVFVTGSGFPAGTINASDVTVTLTPAAGVRGPTATTTATSVVVLSSLRRIYFTVPTSL